MLVRERQLVPREVAARGHHEPLRVDEPAAASRLRLVGPFLHHRGDDQLADPGRGRAGAVEEHPLLAERPPGGARRGVEPGQRHPGGALDVVVERADPVAVALEDAEGVLGREVLPLEQRVGEDLLHRVDELGDERLVLGAAQPRPVESGIERRLPQLDVLGADVERHRQAARRVDPGAGGVERQLAHRDAHPLRAEVAEAEDPLAVGDHEDLDVAVGPVLEQLPHPAAVLGRDVEAAVTAEDLAPALARLAHGGRVDDRHHLGDVVDHGAVEQRLVPVEQAGEVDVLLELGALQGEMREGAADLVGKRDDARRQQPPEAEGVALRLGERHLAVVPRVLQEVIAAQGDLRVHRRSGMRQGKPRNLPRAGPGWRAGSQDASSSRRAASPLAVPGKSRAQRASSSRSASRSPARRCRSARPVLTRSAWAAGGRAARAAP